MTEFNVASNLRQFSLGHTVYLIKNPDFHTKSSDYRSKKVKNGL